MLLMNPLCLGASGFVIMTPNGIMYNRFSQFCGHFTLSVYSVTTVCEGRLKLLCMQTKQRIII